MTNKKISLPLNTLVCSDAFGLGLTIARVQRTSACKKGKVVTPTIINDDDTEELPATDEHGFDNVEAIEAALDAEDEATEEELAPTPKTSAQWAAEAEKACAHLPEDDADFAERTGQEPSNDDDDAGYADFLANEFE